MEHFLQCGRLPHSFWLPHRTYRRCWVERAIPVPVAVLPVWDESVSHHALLATNTSSGTPHHPLLYTITHV